MNSALDLFWNVVGEGMAIATAIPIAHEDGRTGVATHAHAVIGRRAAEDAALHPDPMVRAATALHAIREARAYTEEKYGEEISPIEA